ncbi:MAG: hypothetical protein IJC84_05340 [Clostridia bacterium]|nr:hypothetical protein [Clostridia bacterium]
MTGRSFRGLYFLIPLALLVAALAVPGTATEGVEEGLAIALSAVKALTVPMVLGGTVLRLFPALGDLTVCLPYCLGLLCGFPAGAQQVAELYSAGRIEKKQAERLLFFSNNCSLPFLFALLGRRGLLLFFLQLILTLPFLICTVLKRKDLPRRETSPLSLSAALTGSLRKAGETLVYVCTCIVFFTFWRCWLCTVLRPTGAWESGLRLFLELTGGVTAQTGITLPLLAAGVGFGGMSVHLQTAGLLSDARLSCKSHLLGKCFLGLAMGAAGYFLQRGL